MENEHGPVRSKRSARYIGNLATRICLTELSSEPGDETAIFVGQMPGLLGSITFNLNA